MTSKNRERVTVFYQMKFEQWTGEAAKVTRCRATFFEDGRVGVEWRSEDGVWRDDQETVDGDYVITRAEMAEVVRVTMIAEPLQTAGGVIYELL